MKTQTFADYTLTEKSPNSKIVNKVHLYQRYELSNKWWCDNEIPRLLLRAYIKARGNRTDYGDPAFYSRYVPKYAFELPGNGTYVWVKGIEKGKFVYGEKDSKGNYNYVIRYKASKDDENTMRTNDTIYKKYIESKKLDERTEQEISDLKEMQIQKRFAYTGHQTQKKLFSDLKENGTEKKINNDNKHAKPDIIIKFKSEFFGIEDEQQPNHTLDLSQLAPC